jgi:hypothetical protein
LFLALQKSESVVGTAGVMGGVAADYTLDVLQLLATLVEGVQVFHQQI